MGSLYAVQYRAGLVDSMIVLPHLYLFCNKIDPIVRVALCSVNHMTEDPTYFMILERILAKVPHSGKATHKGI